MGKEGYNRRVLSEEIIKEKEVTDEETEKYAIWITHVLWGLRKCSWQLQGQAGSAYLERDNMADRGGTKMTENYTDNMNKMLKEIGLEEKGLCKESPDKKQ